MKVRLRDVALQRKGWSLYALANMLHMPQQTIYSWASGRTFPAPRNLDLLCQVLGCRIDDLLEPEPVQLDLDFDNFPHRQMRLFEE